MFFRHTLVERVVCRGSGLRGTRVDGLKEPACDDTRGLVADWVEARVLTTKCFVEVYGRYQEPVYL